MPRRLAPDQRRAQLLDAAAAAFAAQGPGVPTRAIAAAAGVSEALLFHYFPDKEALWLAVASRAGTFAHRMRGLLEPGERPLREALVEAALAYAEIVAEERQIVAILLGAALRDEPLGAAVREAHAAMIGELAATFAAAGLARPGAEAEALATGLLGGFVLHFLVHHRDEDWRAGAAVFATSWLDRLLCMEVRDAR